MIRSTRSANRHEFRYLLFAFLPPLLVGALFAGGWAVDYQATEQVDRLVAELTPETRPSLRVVGNYSYDDYRYDVIGGDGDQLGSKLSLAAAEINARIDQFTRTFDGSQSDSFFDSADNWPAASVLEQILADAAPVIREIADTANDLDNGLIDLDVPIVRLLMHRLRLAGYQENHVTALETLQWMHNIAQQSNRSSHEAKFMLQTLYDGISETLAIGFWQTPESVQRLRDLVDEPLPVKSAGLRILRQGRLDALATIDRDRRGQTAFGRRDIHTPSRFHLHLLDHLQQIEQSWEINPMAIHQELRTLDDQSGQWNYLTIAGAPYADVRSYNSCPCVWGVRRQLEILAETEYRRWITSTLVAIKQYQLETGKWPRSVTELSKVGRSPGVWYPEIERTLQFLPTPNGDRAVLKRPRDHATATEPSIGKIMRSDVHLAWFDEDLVK